MAKQYDVFILTVNGKGYRLARDLAISGRQVAWCDISDNTGLHSKDLAGPFCSAVPTGASDLYRREFFQDHDLTPLRQGWTLWHNRGVFEGRGTIADHQAEILKQPRAVQALREISRSGRSVTLNSIEGVFAEHWLLFLAANLDKARLEMDFAPLREEESIFPVFAEAYAVEQDYSLRRKRTQELEVLGVEVVKPEPPQFRYEGDEFYFYHTDAGMARAKHFVSFLSGWDVLRIDPTFYRQIYQGEPLVAEHHWHRLDVEFDRQMDTEIVPQWLVLLQNWDLPWLEDNLGILRFHQQDQSWSLWVRVLTDKLAEAEYCENLEKRLSLWMQKKFATPLVSVRWPHEVAHHSQQSPIIAYPLYSALKKGPKKIVPTFVACGPDAIGSLNIFDLYRQQKIIYQQIIAGETL